MILLNFSHPFTTAQQAQIETMSDQPFAQIIDLQPQFDEQQPFLPQLQDLVAQVNLSAEAWQSDPIIAALPSLNFIAGLILAELHGRMGYFPPILRTRPVGGSMPRRYEIAELLDLQAVRENARKSRAH